MGQRVADVHRRHGIKLQALDEHRAMMVGDSLGDPVGQPPQRQQVRAQVGVRHPLALGLDLVERQLALDRRRCELRPPRRPVGDEHELADVMQQSAR